VLVVDANSLIRAVPGVRVRSLIVKYGAVVDLFAPDTAWAEAREHLPLILRKRDVPVEAGVLLLNSLEEIIQPVEFETYGSFEPVGRTRLASRDPDDWPVLATALALSSDMDRRQ
jgi:predicted nucleic acid-binding protein